tara:strand:- start:3665 stop:5941 length:2277 start_codon:yes stop_codon:yes gene_type:complete
MSTFKFVSFACCLPFFSFAQQSPNIDKTKSDDCYVVAPVEPYKPSKKILEKDTIKIQSQKTVVSMDHKAKFQGKVSFTQRDKKIQADEITYNKKNQQVEATGSILYQDKDLTVKADSFSGNTETKHAEIENSHYWLNSKNIHGQAQIIDVKNKQINMMDASITSCPENNKTWSLSAREINLDQDDGWADIWFSSLKLYDVPVLYLPYLSIPTSRKRKSGFLPAEIGSSSNDGWNITAPYYWNIAPNYDATLTPVYVKNTSLFLKTEFRYLWPYHQGSLKLEGIHDKRVYLNQRRRYALELNSKSHSTQHLRSSIEYAQVSDPLFFKDYNSNIKPHSTSQLNRSGQVGYYAETWDLGLRVQNIKLLRTDNKPYQVYPEMIYNYRIYDIQNSNIDFDLHTNSTLFVRDEKHKETEKVTRLHLEPALTLPIISPQGSWISETKLFYTFYDQPQQDHKSQQRLIPQIKLSGKLDFERYDKFLDIPYRQTLEPKVQYLYRPYVDQKDIGIYDTDYLSDSSKFLFQERDFSGLDRISNKNQLTVGLSSAFFNQRSQEKARLSVGQIFYFKQKKVSLIENETKQSVVKDKSKSSFVIEYSMNPIRNWYWSSSVVLDSKYENIQQVYTHIDYRLDEANAIQLSYRYKPSEDKTQVVQQTGTRMLWSITDRVSIAGTHYYDLNINRHIESVIGLQYTSCCWGVGVNYGSYLKSQMDDYTNKLKPYGAKENKFGIYFFIPNIGSKKSYTHKMLQNSIYNYRTPIYSTR